MLFYIYVGSTVYVWFDTIKHQKYLDKRLKDEGYVFTSKKYFGLGDVVIGGFYAIALSIPVFNLLFPLSHLNKDRSYDEYKNYLLDAGAIEEKEVVNEIKKDNNIKDNYREKVDKVFNQSVRKIYRPENLEVNDTLEEEKGYTYKKILK